MNDAPETTPHAGEPEIPPPPPSVPPAPNKILDVSLNEVTKDALLARAVRHFEAMEKGAPCEACGEGGCVGYPTDADPPAEFGAFLAHHWPKAHEPGRPGGNGARLAFARSLRDSKHLPPDPEDLRAATATAVDVACDAPDAAPSGVVPVGNEMDGQGAAAAVEPPPPVDAPAFDYLAWEPSRRSAVVDAWKAAHPGRAPSEAHERAFAQYAEDEIAYVVTRAAELEAAWHETSHRVVTDGDQTRWGLKALDEFAKAHPFVEPPPAAAETEPAPDSHEEIADTIDPSDEAWLGERAIALEGEWKTLHGVAEVPSELRGAIADRAVAELAFLKDKAPAIEAAWRAGHPNGEEPSAERHEAWGAELLAEFAEAHPLADLLRAAKTGGEGS